MFSWIGLLVSGVTGDVITSVPRRSTVSCYWCPTRVTRVLARQTANRTEDRKPSKYIWPCDFILSRGVGICGCVRLLA